MKRFKIARRTKKVASNFLFVIVSGQALRFHSFVFAVCVSSLLTQKGLAGYGSLILNVFLLLHSHSHFRCLFVALFTSIDCAALSTKTPFEKVNIDISKVC